jgi:hypothetical protein
MNHDEINYLNELWLDRELLEELNSKIDTSINIFDILRVSDLEIRHSNILAWLFDSTENHGLGSMIIQHLIHWLANESNYVVASNEKEALLRCNYDSFIVRREKDGIDLLLYSLEAKIVIVIENKMKSLEHGNQLLRYKKTIEKRFQKYQYHFLYLTLFGDASSEPEIWWSIGYEEVSKWIENSLNVPTLCVGTKQILEQYLVVLRRKIMGYHSEEVKELCDKIYNKHKKALQIIFEVMEYPSGTSEIKDWSDEWELKKLVRYPEMHSNYLAFRTPLLEKLFPQVDGLAWPCYYWLWPIPFPKQVSLQFVSKQLDATLVLGLQKIKEHYNKKLKAGWDKHILKTWRLSYNLDESDDFIAVSSNLRTELERIISIDIPQFENEMKKIMYNKH